MNKILFEDGLIIKDILLWVDLFEKKNMFEMIVYKFFDYMEFNF